MWGACVEAIKWSWIRMRKGFDNMRKGFDNKRRKGFDNMRKGFDKCLGYVTKTWKRRICCFIHVSCYILVWVTFAQTDAYFEIFGSIPFAAHMLAALLILIMFWAVVGALCYVYRELPEIRLQPFPERGPLIVRDIYYHTIATIVLVGNFLVSSTQGHHLTQKSARIMCIMLSISVTFGLAIIDIDEIYGFVDCILGMSLAVAASSKGKVLEMVMICLTLGFVHSVGPFFRWLYPTPPNENPETGTETTSDDSEARTETRTEAGNLGDSVSVRMEAGNLGDSMEAGTQTGNVRDVATRSRTCVPEAQERLALSDAVDNRPPLVESCVERTRENEVERESGDIMRSLSRRRVNSGHNES